MRGKRVWNERTVEVYLRISLNLDMMWTGSVLAFDIIIIRSEEGREGYYMVDAVT